MSRTGIATLLCALGALSLPAHANGLTYSFVEAGYLESKDDKDGVDGDGFRLDLGVSLLRWLNFTGEFETRDFDETGVGLDLTSVGFGVHSLRRDFHLFAALTYERLDQTTSGGSYEDEGYGFQFGARVPWRQFEFQADYKYLDYGDVAGTSQRLDDARYRVQSLFRFSPSTAAAVTWQTYEDFGLDEWTVGVRQYFATRYDRAPRRR